MPEQLHVVISGLVQGVGYRHATYRRALECGVTGWVRNLPNGDVEAVFQGDRATVDRMLQWCQDGPALARVERVQEIWETPSENLDHFQIVF